ncbi:probable protein phosphatase 2C 55 [Pyrus communis]|uniref:probable protein phosphatase 2C 55 n=1 Tax=Pyrus communis TaxID=23211 RepID=UPI0035C229A6
MTSSYLSKIRTALQRSIVGQEGALQESVDGLIGQGKLLFGNSKLFQSRPFSTISDLQALFSPGIVFAARLDLQLVNKRRNISVVEEISRIISTPSVSGPSIQVCGYHIDCALSEPSQFVTRSKFQNKPMAACGSRTLFGGCCPDNLTSRRGLHAMVPESACTLYNKRSLDCFQTASMSLKTSGQSNTNAIYGYFMYEVGKRWCNSSPSKGSGSREFHGSSTCSSTRTAHDVSFDSSAHEGQVSSSAPEEQLSSSADSSNEKITDGKSLKLTSGSYYLPHPDKEETGGEDAHFICANEQAIGVADGVGGWADLGVNSGLYSRELMSNSVAAVQEEPKGSIDPARVLEKAHSSTKARGSSTACIIALTEQGIHAVNLGDSGFIVVRDGCTVFRSPVQQHDFNFTYQLESGNSGDLPSSGQVFTVPVAPRDVIVAGTDGLFDNLYNNEITAVVVHAIRAGLGPQVTAQKIAALARQRAQDRDRQTPFSTAAQDAGFRYYGGKLDDITVVVSYVTSSNDP